MEMKQFHNALRILMSIEYHEVPWMGVERYAKFANNPFLFFVRASDEDAMRIWEVVVSRQPGGATSLPQYVVFDTETTGLFDFKLPADDPSQPRLASVAFILSDAAGKEIEREKFFIQPDGWEMPEEAGAVNGLTTEFLAENGIPVSEVLDVYQGYVERGLIVAAFNAQFDAKVMRAEFRRAGRHDLFEKTRNTCVMRGLKPYADQGLVIKGGQYVSLEKACVFFGITNDNAHDAMADAEAARAILEILIKDGNVIEPKVHYAKVQPVGAE